VIIAPAGFGKTTLVASCVTDCGMPVAWLSLNKNDNQTEWFLNYLVAALQETDPTIGNKTAKLMADIQDKNILVTYASKYGATKEIAEKIGEVLRQAGLRVDVLPVDGMRDLSPYKAVILGSAIYVDKWQKEALQLLRANEKILANRPVWIFSSGPTGKGDPLNWWRSASVSCPAAGRRSHPSL